MSDYGFIDEIMSKWLPKAKNMTIMGQPIDSLSKETLMAALVMQYEEHKREIETYSKAFNMFANRRNA